MHYLIINILNIKFHIKYNETFGLVIILINNEFNWQMLRINYLRKKNTSRRREFFNRLIRVSKSFFLLINVFLIIQ